MTSLGNITLDGETADGDGNIWYMSDIAGWEAPTHRLSQPTRPGEHGAITALNLYEGRQMTLFGFAVCEDEDGYYAARATLLSETAKLSPFTDSPLTLTVSEDIDRSMTVVKTGLQIRCIDHIILDFEINLFADDPFKYGAEHTVDTTGNADNEGNAPTWPTFTLTAPGDPILYVNGDIWSASGLPSGAVINMHDLTVIESSVSYFANVDTPSIWSSFAPGVNTVVSTVAGIWTWKDGYL